MMASEISTLIANIGFPSVCVLGLAFYINKMYREHLALQQQQMLENSKVMNEARDVNKELLISNRELLETNRILADKISVKIDNVENNIIEIKSVLGKKYKDTYN